MANLERLFELTKLCNEFNADLIAVSKTKPASEIQEAYDAGHRKFGENRVRELVEKAQTLPDDIEWHMIGHLQRNKVKDLMPYVTMIHAVDSVRLANEISKQASKAGKTVSILLQVHIARESTKYGFDSAELEQVLDDGAILALPCIRIAGFMGMATFTDDEEQVTEEFRHLSQLFHKCRSAFFSESPEFRHISMGMSGDYQLALQEGSTMIRVGSAIFGARPIN